jgi:hypothetical protein
MEASEQLKFSLFYDISKGIFATEPIKEINFTRLIEIYNSKLVQDVTRKIKEADETTKKQLKKQLPFITPFGTFAPTRANVNITNFNRSLLCLDIDGLKENEVQLVKFILTSHYSTLLCAVSPRGRGIKALIILDTTIPQHECYNTLKLNKYHIAECLGLQQFVSKIDDRQFVLSQPWLIAHDPELYVNENCTPLVIYLIPYTPPATVIEPVNFDLINLAEQSNYKEPINYRISKYFENATNNLIKFFALCSEGNRHSSIIKVQSIASWLHYAPSLEQDIKNKLYEACCNMYGGHKQAIENNVHKSFERAWNNAPIKQNFAIEDILSDPKYNTQHVSIKNLINSKGL